jgi:hypothetical protein
MSPTISPSNGALGRQGTDNLESFGDAVSPRTPSKAGEMDQSMKALSEKVLLLLKNDEAVVSRVASIVGT